MSDGPMTKEQEAVVRGLMVAGKKIDQEQATVNGLYPIQKTLAYKRAGQDALAHEARIARQKAKCRYQKCQQGPILAAHGQIVFYHGRANGDCRFKARNHGKQR